MYITTRALVLRQVKYKEADKILTILTEDEGKMTVSARAVMRRGSKIAAGCQLLTFSEMTLYENRGKWFVREAQPVEQFLGLRDDIEKLALATYFTELLENVSDEDYSNGAILSIGLNSLFVLANDLYSQEHIKAVFELRMMCISGFEPSLEGCPVCGEVNIKDPVFGTLSGMVSCRNCRLSENGKKYPLCEASLAAMRFIAWSDREKIFSFKLEEGAQKKLYKVCENYVIDQLERKFYSLDYWKSLK